VRWRRARIVQPVASAPTMMQSTNSRLHSGRNQCHEFGKVGFSVASSGLGP
jgi:hypothetical protein